ncbi:hypothetical protein BX666DRAFT_1932415 [Dichotomocladium elegans]|nr:hypothetical protein BX666DRAFT_1932415 [Dichotomocladium elegans]
MSMPVTSYTNANEGIECLTKPLESAQNYCFIHIYIYDLYRSWTVGYSSKTLLQFDPSPWCDANMQYTPMDPKIYQLPDPAWQWVSKEWMVDMSGDVDEAGWQYALKFHGAVWHGNYKHFRSFVRRRRWVRLRRRLPPISGAEDDPKPSIPSRKLVAIDDGPQTASTDNPHTQDYQLLVNNLQTCRLDRERLAMVRQALTVDGMPEKILSEPQAVLNMLEYESSKRDLFKLLLAARPSRELNIHEKQALQGLCFYSDVQYLLESIESKSF